MAKLYVLIRNDLPKNYQAVQAGHAVAQFVLDHPDKWKNETLVYLRVDGENDLVDWNIYLHQYFSESYSCFYEPDLDGELTALAALSTERTDKLFESFRLV